jgi:hypothetical protein
MAVPWLRLIDAALGIHDLVRLRRARSSDDADVESRQLRPPQGLQGLESRLASVVVAALKETFDRDSKRLELERQRIEMERERAERAMRLELVRQSTERETARLRFIAAVSIAIVVASFFLVPRVAGPGGSGFGPRATLGAGWIMLVASIWRALAGQAGLARTLDRVAADLDLATELDVPKPDPFSPWFLVAGLALVAVAVLVA